MTYRSPSLALSALLGSFLTPAVVAFPAHEDDPKIFDQRPAVPGPGYRRAADPFALGPRDLASASAASTFASQGMRLESWLTLSELGGGNGNDCWGYAAPSGREYALMGTTRGTAIVEVTDPAAATVVEIIDGPNSIWRDIKVYQDRAYVVSEGGEGIQVLDLRQVDAGVVTLENTVTTGGSPSTHNVAIDEDSGFLYRTGGSGNGLRIYRLTDPANPQFVGSWSQRYVHDAQVVTYSSGPYAGRQIAYCCSGFGNGSIDTGLSILDVTNKSSIQVIGQLDYPNASYSHQGWLSADRTRFYLGDELDQNRDIDLTVTRVFDVSDPGAASYIGEFTNGIRAVNHNMYERDGYLFQANYTSGVRVLDIDAGPDAPPEIAHFDSAPDASGSTFNGLWSCYPNLPSGIVLGSDRERGLFVWSFDPLAIDVADAELRELSPGGESVIAEIRELTPGTLDTATISLIVDAGNGAVTIPMVPGATADAYEAQLPSFPCGAVVEWYVSATTNSGIQSTFPATAPLRPFVSLVGSSVTTIREDDMGTDAGWTGGLPGDTAIDGAWERGFPIGTRAEPAGGFPSDDDRLCWFTGQQAVANNADADVDGGFTTLLTPVLDLSGLDFPAVEYERWFSNVFGMNDPDDSFVVEISNDAGATWTTLEVVDPLSAQAAGGWFRASFLVPRFVVPTDQVQVRFVASDLGRSNIVEAAIDDFRVYDAACSAPVGTAYCSSAPNSIGSVSAIVGQGTDFLTRNDLALLATDLPPGVLGLFVVSANQAFVPNPGGSQGNLCVGAGTGRYLSQAGSADAAGTLALVVDATAIPQPNGDVSAGAGETWNFQCWHRDGNPGPTSNFTTGYSVTFR
ncbi:MAG: choice-of-anchor B family protein [Planctomycetota bacterium]